MQNSFAAEMASVKKRIEAVRKENSLVFPLFTDLHTSGVEAEGTKKLLDALSLICGEVRPDAVIDLGDNLSMLGRQQHISNAQLAEILTGLFDSIHCAAGCPLYLVNGNHDAVGTDFFKPALWNRIVRGKYDDGRIHQHPSGAYYYVDYEHANLRIVFLSVPYESDIASENPTPLWAFGSTQLEWLEKEALNTDYDVLLFSHVPFYYHYQGDQARMMEVWDGEKTAKSYVSALCGWIDDAEEAASIIAQRGNVIACFSGHTHEDSLWQPYEQRDEDKNYLPCCQVVTTHAEHSKESDMLGVAIDILVWNPDEREVHLIRFGEGADREVRNVI